jgi:hypothetical protein
MISTRWRYINQHTKKATKILIGFRIVSTLVLSRERGVFFKFLFLVSAWMRMLSVYSYTDGWIPPWLEAVCCLYIAAANNAVLCSNNRVGETIGNEKTKVNPSWCLKDRKRNQPTLYGESAIDWIVFCLYDRTSARSYIVVSIIFLFLSYCAAGIFVVVVRLYWPCMVTTRLAARI